MAGWMVAPGQTRPGGGTRSESARRELEVESSVGGSVAGGGALCAMPRVESCRAKREASDEVEIESRTDDDGVEEEEEEEEGQLPLARSHPDSQQLAASECSGAHLLASSTSRAPPSLAFTASLPLSARSRPRPHPATT